MTEQYHNPILDRDWPDPDVTRHGDEFVLVASSGSRAPGLPILTSPNLIDWTIAGHAIDRLPAENRFREPEPGNGVWAPAIRSIDGELRVYWADPDEGAYTVSASGPGGEWSAPRLVLRASGVIDPCPFWDDDGRVWLAHGWARSRAGFANRIDLVELSPDGLAVAGDSRVLIDGDAIDGCSVLEGPKLYRSRGWYWLFAPAGGVSTGWQYAFRSRSLAGPWTHRIVLAQHDTPVNGPHQGAWVHTPEGEDWFLHFQDRGWAGRVTHLQPMRWNEEGWPVIGDDGRPVRSSRVPAGLPAVQGVSPQASDDWSAGPGPQWSWQANPPLGAEWCRTERGTLILPAVTGSGSRGGSIRSLPQVLSQSVPGSGATFGTTIELTGRSAARGGIAILGDAALWCGLVRDERDGVGLVCVGLRDESEHLLAEIVAESGVVAVTATIDDAGCCTITARIDGKPHLIVENWGLRADHWVAASFGLFCAGGEEHSDTDSALRVGPISVTTTMIT